MSEYTITLVGTATPVKNIETELALPTALESGTRRELLEALPDDVEKGVSYSVELGEPAVELFAKDVRWSVAQ